MDSRRRSRARGARRRARTGPLPPCEQTISEFGAVVHLVLWRSGTPGPVADHLAARLSARCLTGEGARSRGPVTTQVEPAHYFARADAMNVIVPQVPTVLSLGGLVARDNAIDSVRGDGGELRRIALLTAAPVREPRAIHWPQAESRIGRKP
jgi:hypothetical protein